MEFKKIISGLSLAEKKELSMLLRSSIAGTLNTEVKACPCCGSANYTKKGVYKDTQRFKCKDCNKRFTYRTSTVVSGLHKHDKLGLFIEMLDESTLPTLSKIQKNCGVSRQTAHNWKNKILSDLYKPVDFSYQLVEFDEGVHRFSQKGRQGCPEQTKAEKKASRKKIIKAGDHKMNVKVMMSYSRVNGNLAFHVSHMGNTKANQLSNYLSKYAGISAYTDSNPTYINFFSSEKIFHKTFVSKDHISYKDKNVHCQAVNGYAKEFKRCVRHHHCGVSTKYLQNYCNWLNFFVNFKNRDKAIAETLLENKVALSIYKQKEREYQYFLRNNNIQDSGRFIERYKLFTLRDKKRLGIAA